MTMAASKVELSAIELKEQTREVAERKATEMSTEMGTEMSMVRTIEILAQWTHAMQARGYTMADVAETLRTHGIPMPRRF